mmetsp:Transcript_60332/g.171428  ORF Transcript_60332/g.171428 Transcript_60332/m.171428 type:complete len:221 (-) Transcript_60332:353-1015(-)
MPGLSAHKRLLSATHSSSAAAAARALALEGTAEVAELLVASEAPLRRRLRRRSIRCNSCGECLGLAKSALITLAVSPSCESARDVVAVRQLAPLALPPCRCLCRSSLLDRCAVCAPGDRCAGDSCALGELAAAAARGAASEPHLPSSSAKLANGLSRPRVAEDVVDAWRVISVRGAEDVSSCRRKTTTPSSFIGRKRLPTSSQSPFGVTQPLTAWPQHTS